MAKSCLRPESAPLTENFEANDVFYVFIFTLNRETYTLTRQHFPLAFINMKVFGKEIGQCSIETKCLDKYSCPTFTYIF